MTELAEGNDIDELSSIGGSLTLKEETHLDPLRPKHDLNSTPNASNLASASRYEDGRSDDTKDGQVSRRFDEEQGERESRGERTRSCRGGVSSDEAKTTVS